MKIALGVGRPYVLWVIGLISCSMLMYEILLTRVGALRLFFHFSYLVVGNCLLAIGVSGTIGFNAVVLTSIAMYIVAFAAVQTVKP